jgi:hypothetical protein
MYANPAESETLSDKTGFPLEIVFKVSHNEMADAAH